MTEGRALMRVARGSDVGSGCNLATTEGRGKRGDGRRGRGTGDGGREGWPLGPATPMKGNGRSGRSTGEGGDAEFADAADDADRLRRGAVVAGPMNPLGVLLEALETSARRRERRAVPIIFEARGARNSSPPRSDLHDPPNLRDPRFTPRR
jgi:hypothetical protein